MLSRDVVKMGRAGGGRGAAAPPEQDRSSRQLMDRCGERPIGSVFWVGSGVSQQTLNDLTMTMS